MEKDTRKPLSKVIRIDESEIRGHLTQLVRGAVEETLNAKLDAEAEELCQAQRYERSADRIDTRAGHYKRKRRKGVAVPREPLQLPEERNAVWSMDFIFDALSTGRRLKGLAIVDDCTKELVDLVADSSISGHYVYRVLDRAARFRGYPQALRSDRGPKFTGKALDQWAYEHGVELKLI